MCAHYEVNTTVSRLIEQANCLYDEEHLKLSWDKQIYPFGNAPVITRYSNNNFLRVMRFSLVPSWSDTPKPKFATYNARLDRINKKSARLEHIYEAPTWKHSFKNNRCLVPISTFYESCHEGDYEGHIVKFEPKQENKTLFAAGIWNKWESKETEEIIFSFAIITHEPSDFIKKVGHDRQPVFLSSKDANSWLSTDKLEPKDAYEFLKNSQEQLDYKVTEVRKMKSSS